MSQLIINADDFGLAPGINRSVASLARAGSISSTTLMANAPYMEAAAEHADPALAVGCHVVLVDGDSTLAGSSVPGLVSASGAFRPTLAGFVVDLIRGLIPESEIELEAAAQIRRVQAAGIRVTHVDTHKHTHMFPRVLRPLLRAARACGVPAIRNPFEPGWASRATPHSPFVRKTEVRLLTVLRRRFLALVDQSGIRTTDGALGVLATGTLDERAVESLLRAMPSAGTWELVCHPGFPDEALNRVRTRLRASRAVEHAALLASVPRFLATHPGVHLVNFSGLHASGG